MPHPAKLGGLPSLKLLRQTLMRRAMQDGGGADDEEAFLARVCWRVTPVTRSAPNTQDTRTSSTAA